MRRWSSRRRRTVHRIRTWRPDRIAGFSPIPAMSMVSHAVGARFHALIGAPMLSFYGWYADLPVAFPQVFGDQTDVPEAGDWWDASYLVLWGSNAARRGGRLSSVPPDVQPIAHAPFTYQLHATAAWMIWALWPFSRLVHVWSYPLWYLWRPYIVYRNRRPAPPSEPGTGGRKWRRIGAPY